MESCDQEKLRSELVRLMEKQADTLREQTFGSEAELHEYDERQERIRDLLIELHLF